MCFSVAVMSTDDIQEARYAIVEEPSTDPEPPHATIYVVKRHITKKKKIFQNLNYRIFYPK